MPNPVTCVSCGAEWPNHTADCGFDPTNTKTDDDEQSKP
jgi:hypothetical protein